MKSTILTFSAIVSISLSTGVAADGPGCGWGRMLWQGQSGLLPHTSAATTNSSSSNQWFGITSGTLGCDPDATVNNDYQREVFAVSNYDNLAREAARGEGDHLSTLAEIMGIETSDRVVFYSMTQHNYETLFGASMNDPMKMLTTLDATMRTNPVLARYVK